MRAVVLLILALISSDPREIAKVNSIKREAEQAFLDGKYQTAVEKYSLLDSLNVDDPAIDLNLAHAYYKLQDSTGANTYYQSVLNSSDDKLRSIAYQQLGVMKKDAQKYEEALQDLKSSLKTDPTNEGARYDYELVKKLLKEQQEQEQEQDQENQDEDNKDEQNKDEQQDQDQQEGDQEQDKEEGEKEESEEQDGEKKEDENQNGEEEEADKEPTEEEKMQQKLEEMKISPEKAKMILEAMRNNEIQYLQQQKRKATKRPPSGKPDW